MNNQRSFISHVIYQELRGNMRRYLLFAVTMIITILIAYSMGISIGEKKEKEIHQHRKGDGKFFYGEVKNDYMLYHSIPNCLMITTGVGRNNAYLEEKIRLSNSRFCPFCMDEKLIGECFNFLENFEER